jgi:heat shock protein HslJ
LAGLLIALIILAACVSPPPAPPAVPAGAGSSDAPVDAPAPAPPPTDELRMLRANSWQWIAFDEQTGRREIETPASYRVTFNSDASLTIVADCTNASGSYQGESGKLTIEIGPVNMAGCSTQSKSNKFIDLLARAVSYTFKDDNLVVKLAAGGAMRLAPAVQGADEGLPHSSAIVTNDLELKETDMTQHSEPVAGSIKPEYVTALEAAYGALSQAGFGSAVFYEPVKTADGLDQAALAKYRFFVGDLWDRYGEAAWMGPWKRVYTRPADGTPDIVAELRGMGDRQARLSASMVLDEVEDAETARAALAAAFNDPAVSELAVYTLGDGEAMSGILVAGRRDDGASLFLVFLLD